jgi:hypothetical protein
MARIFFQATPQDDLDLGLGLAQPPTFIVLQSRSQRRADALEEQRRM